MIAASSSLPAAEQPTSRDLHRAEPFRFDHNLVEVSAMRRTLLSATLLILAIGFQHFGNAQSTTPVAFAAASFPAAGEPRGIAAADFNLDGWSDIVTANLALNGGSASGIAVFLNNGNGTFGSPTTTATGAGAFDVATGDFNRDGRPDVAVANADANTVSILLGSPATLTPAFTWTTSASPRAVVAADFTRDGRTDLAVAAYTCGCVNIGVGQGDGTFTTVATIDVRANPEGLAAGDFNRDGTLDLYVLSLTRHETVLLGRGDGTFLMFGDTVPGPRGRDVDVADFDRDGNDDVVRVGDNLLQIQAPAQPQFGYGANVRADSRGVVAFDVNSDGWADVAVANRGAGGIEVLVNVPVPDPHPIAFEFPFPRFATGSGARAIASADVNRDGRVDLVVGNQSAKTVTVLRNTTPRAAPISGVQ